MTAKWLGYRELSKQRVHAAQILRIIERKRSWKSHDGPIAMATHPAVLMWEGFEDSLSLYHDTMVAEWVSRGYSVGSRWRQTNDHYDLILPPWLNEYRLAVSHRSFLLRQDPESYIRFEWRVRPDIRLYWPVTTQEDSDYPICEEILYNQRRILCHTR